MVTRNRSEFIEPAIRSVLDQSYKNFEFLIVDDGSTDKTPEILKKWEGSDNRIKVLSRPQSFGLPSGLNLAASQARGQIYARMDDDDISLPERFEKQLKFLEDHPDIIAMGTAIRVIDEDGVDLNEYYPPQVHEEIDAGLLIGHGGALVNPSIMIRKDAFNEVNGYNEKYLKVQDLDIYLRLAEIGRLANLSEVLVLCRTDSRRADRASEEAYKKVHSYLTEIVEAAYKRRKLEGTPRIDLPKVATRHQLLWNLCVGAYSVGNYRAAYKHLTRALKLDPTSLQKWWMFLKVLSRLLPSELKSSKA